MLQKYTQQGIEKDGANDVQFVHLGLIHTLITTKNYYDYHHYCYYCYYTLFIISYHLLFQNHLMDMKRSKVQCKIFVEEYISASFLL